MPMEHINLLIIKAGLMIILGLSLLQAFGLMMLAKKRLPNIQKEVILKKKQEEHIQSQE